MVPRRLLLSPLLLSVLSFFSSAVLLLSPASAFVPRPLAAARPRGAARTALAALPPLPESGDAQSLNAYVAAATAASKATESIATDPWVVPLMSVLDPTLNILSFAMLCRIVISWYPNTPLNNFPYSIVVWPTEPLLAPTRGVVPPAFGVDVSPIVWLGLCSFFHEIFLGQQGLLTLKLKYGI
mmetsp:Transcript_31745/g.62921  ORF Transcript_31745/g.62921 Transcript_31745/m.62921 type:complete len:183 (-) Transcript_31745:49-597(-)|eukprot:CAMPEP_0194304704 /NCGR_PEP_ID=MMETSP0171-20130528/2370_1 /TAXON_ID=218684 /ORGANISM="Corethron pennatum, Strain L29A3" /LENGTH=182 /DNA_ID=CAMNT_0039056047 /DNA_START=62 /DNA_END=610 /DNA_ORIENTATION=+